MDINCAYQGRDLLGESPLWDAKSQKVYWVDALKPALHCLNPQTSQHQEWPMPGLISAIGLHHNGGLIAAIKEGLFYIDLPSGKVRLLKQINSDSAGVHLNDGKCDRLGRFWVGEVSHDKTNPSGKIYCLHPDGRLEIKMTGIALFNGPCWSPCNRFFYFTDSFHKTIYRCPYDLNSATLGPREVFVQIPTTDPSTPDGCTVDQAGYLWSAKWDGYRITRYSPSGTIDCEITLPMQRPTSCIFGGKKLDTLFITSASQDIGETAPLQDIYAGAMFTIQGHTHHGIAEIAFAE
jgi:L-arabinonolactonase